MASSPLDEMHPIIPIDPTTDPYRAFEARVTETLKSLLETKHLYQSLMVESSDLLAALLSKRQSLLLLPERVKMEFYKVIQDNWIPLDNADPPVSSLAPPPARIQFQTPDVKLFCAVCDRREAFNSISSVDFLQRSSAPVPFKSGRDTVQIFTLSFLCQSCKIVPEVFLVRRTGRKLTNSGRSPIEHVEVPAAIPKQIERFYSDAIVAYQSGQVLAGVFLLRTLVEQWARSVVRQPGLQADQVLDGYMETLPADFKDRFPSMRSLYGDLSEDLHAATGSPKLFEKARSDIVEHFEARRLFKVSTSPGPPAPPGPPPGEGE